jgi:DNA invertase Pin-like site-specific DNA recombinase
LTHEKDAALKHWLLLHPLNDRSWHSRVADCLEQAGVEFVAPDMTQANRLTIGIMAVMARHEREMISARAKAALAAAKLEGAKLSGDRGYVITA